MTQKHLAGIIFAAIVLLSGFWFLKEPPSSESVPDRLDRQVEVQDDRHPVSQLDRPPFSASDVSEPRIGLPPPVDLEAVDRDLDLFGIVRNTVGDRIPGAFVEVIIYPWRRVFVMNWEGLFQFETGLATRTASDGTFSLRLRRGEVVDLRATAPGYAPTTRSMCQAGERVEVTLGEPAQLEVVVTDADGQPAPDVQLQLWMWDRSRDPSALFGERRGMTDGTGRFIFSDLQYGSGHLAPKHATLGSPEWVQFEITEPGSQNIEVTMPRGRKISGQVRDAETGEPIEGAQVGSTWVLYRSVETDENGYYEFPGWSGETGGRRLPAIE